LQGRGDAAHRPAMTDFQNSPKGKPNASERNPSRMEQNPNPAEQNPN
jgi:hypothetical protein